MATRDTHGNRVPWLSGYEISLLRLENKKLITKYTSEAYIEYYGAERSEERVEEYESGTRMLIDELYRRGVQNASDEETDYDEEGGPDDTPDSDSDSDSSYDPDDDPDIDSD